MSGEHTIGHIGLDLFLLAPPPAGSQPTLGERGGFAEEPASFACRSMPFLSFLNQLRSRPECDGVKTMPSMGWSDFYKCFWKFGRSAFSGGGDFGLPGFATRACGDDGDIAEDSQSLATADKSAMPVTCPERFGSASPFNRRSPISPSAVDR